MDALDTPQAVETPPLGTPPVPADGAAAVSTPADDDSLAAHEAAHGPATDEPSDDSRDERGRFQKPRHRAKSQTATPDDLPAIDELTKQWKALEDEHGKDIARKDGESDRVFNLRRRVEMAKRLAEATKAQTVPAPAVAPAIPQQPTRQHAPIPQSFPEYEDFIQVQGNEQVTFNQYLDIRTEWNYARLRAIERQTEAAESAQRTMQERAAAHMARVPAAKQKYADWDTVVTNDLPVSRVISEAVLGSAQSTDVQYHLGKHRDLLAALNADSQDYSPSAVAAMRRYLDTLVAPATSSPSSRPAAGPTGAAPTRVSPPAPKPPTPVRTGATTTAEPPGDDDQSLSAHEKFFGRKRA